MGEGKNEERPYQVRTQEKSVGEVMWYFLLQRLCYQARMEAASWEATLA